MSRTPGLALHYLCGQVVTLHQTDSSTIVGRITWPPGTDTCTITRLSDGKTATLNVDQVNWDDGSNPPRPWPWGSNDANPNYVGTPVVPA